MINVSNLSVTRNHRPILHDLSVTCEPGQVTVILGPNGSGKSTLLSALSGSLAYTGSARINGLHVAHTPPTTMAEHRAVLTQDTQVAFAFRVGQVVALAARNPSPARIDAMLARVGLAGFAQRNCHSLSGGESQRMHLARVLMQAQSSTVPNPWLLLDEPVSSLDIAQQLLVMRLARAHADAGGGVLAVLHDLNLAAMFADRLLVVHQGRIAAHGTPDQVLTNALIEQVYGCHIPIRTAPPSGPWVLVQSAH